MTALSSSSSSSSSHSPSSSSSSSLSPEEFNQVAATAKERASLATDAFKMIIERQDFLAKRIEELEHQVRELKHG